MAQVTPRGTYVLRKIIEQTPRGTSALEITA